MHRIAALLPILLCSIAAAPAAQATFIGIGWDGSVSLFDEVTGESTLLGPSGLTNANTLAGTPAQGLFTIDARTDEIARIDPRTGVAQVISALEIGFSYRGLAVAWEGTLFGVRGTNAPGNDDDLEAAALDRIDIATGAITTVGLILVAERVGLQSLEVGPDGALYAWSNGVGLITIDPTTGTGTDVDTAVRGPLMQSIAFSPDGILYGVKEELGDDPAFNTEIYTIDTATGVATRVAVADPDDTRGIAFVPEPQGLMFLLLAVILGAQAARSRALP